MACKGFLCDRILILHQLQHSEKRDPEIEERLNLHIGRPYAVEERSIRYDCYKQHRAAVDGKPYTFQVETVVHNGILSKIYFHLCKEGFIPLDIVLKDGFSYPKGNPHQNNLFEYVRLFYGDPKELGRFSRIEDEEGFARAVRLMRDGAP